MTAPQVFRAADVIARAMRSHSSNPMLLAEALESAQLLQSPETAAELERLRARLAEYERPADEDPIRYTPTEQSEGEVSVPRTERQRWVDIADALNAAHAADMPVSVDLDGTLTDHRMWSVVWDRQAERWTVAGYEDDAEQAAAERPVSVGETYWRRAEPGVTVKVTRVWQKEDADEPSVAFDIRGRDWRGRPCTSFSALRLSLFRELYRLDTTVPQPGQAQGGGA